MSITDDDVLILAPGEIYFGHSPKIIKTLLGSCVSMTVWHRKIQVGGLCHYLIAQDSKKIRQVASNYRYGITSLEYLYQEMCKYGDVSHFDISLFGGGNMYTSSTAPSIGEANVSFAKRWLKKHKITLKQEATLGNVSRKIVFDLSTGEIQLTLNEER